MAENSLKAIGVFDSGLGGLTVVKELIDQLPDEDIVYFGDTARVPYGTKSKESIVRFSVENTEILLKEKVKCIVVACNSSSSYALPMLKKRFDVPIVGVIGPGASKAAEITRNDRVGIIATSATIQSRKYEKAIKRKKEAIKVFSQACPLFVPLVEEGWISKAITKDIIKEYLAALTSHDIDTLILGCTHYPLLKNMIASVVGNGVQLVDSAKEVASEIKTLLNNDGLNKIKDRRKGKIRFLISDKPQSFKKQAKAFLGREIKHIKKITNR